jgi:hypothetical protein
LRLYDLGPLLIPVVAMHIFVTIDDSVEVNGSLRYYVVGFSVPQIHWLHQPLAGNNRHEGHALTVHVGEEEQVQLTY